MGGTTQNEQDTNIIEDDLFDAQDLLNQQPKSKSPPLGKANVKKIMDDQQNVLILDGQFAVTKGYGNDAKAALFSVGNAHQPKGGKHIVYTIFVSFCL